MPMLPWSWSSLMFVLNFAIFFVAYIGLGESGMLDSPFRWRMMAVMFVTFGVVAVVFAALGNLGAVGVSLGASCGAAVALNRSREHAEVSDE